MDDFKNVDNRNNNIRKQENLDVYEYTYMIQRKLYIYIYIFLR